MNKEHNHNKKENRKSRIKFMLFTVIFILLLPAAYSNGGCIKIADDVFVQLSSSPLVPVVDRQASFLISFGNTNKELVKEEINGKIWLTKDGENILIKDFKIKDGILDLKHTFKNSGLYEIFLDFRIGNKTYMPEDFLIEVTGQKNDFVEKIAFLAVGMVIGLVLMKLIPSLRKQLNR